MLTAALTGGIGSGKSEAANRFAALGAVIVDSDQIAHQVVEPGSDGLRQVVAEFGDGVLSADGSLDREKLAATVFGDDNARRRLNGILHPLIGARAMAEVNAAGERDPDAVVIQDIPLLAESGLAEHYGIVIVVDVPVETQLDRLVRLRGMADDAAQARIAAQATREQRRAVATYLIDNSGDLESLDRQVRSIWAELAGGKCPTPGVR